MGKRVSTFGRLRLSRLGSDLIFAPLCRLVIRRPRTIVLAWVVLTAGLHLLAPPWDLVTRDDDVQFFPADCPSVIAHELLQQGFPQDASSSQLVLIYERKNGRLTTNDLGFVDDETASLGRYAREHPELGVKQIDTHRSPLIGPRLIATSVDGRDQATLSIVSLDSTHLARKTQLAVDTILNRLTADKATPPQGLARLVTGSSAVGHDTNTATEKSIEKTTSTTIALVILTLLVVYRSPLFAMVPIVTIALSVVVSLRLIALLTLAPGLGIQVISITPIFVVVVLFGAGTDYCLFLLARYREELGKGRSRSDAISEAIRQVGAALAASAATVIVGLGMLWFSSFAAIRYTGPTIALSLAVALVAALTLAPALVTWLGDILFWPFAPPPSRG